MRTKDIIIATEPVDIDMEPETSTKLGVGFSASVDRTKFDDDGD